MSITGLGPHGERAQLPERLRLTDEDAATARARRFSVAVVLHTTTSDWAKQQLAGIVKALELYCAAVVEVADCQFSAEIQIQTLNQMQRERPDAIISLPVGNAAVAEAHRDVSKAGIKLILLDNAPTGLLPSADYASVVSADNFGLGQIGAQLLSPHIPQGGTVGVLAYRVDFFATNEREIGFHEWMERQRPDIVLKQAKFAEARETAQALNRLLDAHPETVGLFAVWDEPAMQAVTMLKSRAVPLPMTTIDLGNEAALELAGGAIVKGIGAQQPFDQGVAAAKVAILALIGRQPPPWVALPGLAVTPENVIEAYQVIWHSPASPELVRAHRAAMRDS